MKPTPKLNPVLPLLKEPHPRIPIHTTSTICHPPNHPQPRGKRRRKPLKTTQKYGMTDGETSENSPFTHTTHIQHTTQCAQHTHLCVQRVTPRHHYTECKLNPPLAQLWAPLSHISRASLNVFVKDRRRLRFKQKLASKKEFLKNKNEYKNSY